MIIELEIDQFIKEIESKLQSTPEALRKNGEDKIALLYRIKWELQESQRTLQKSMMLTAKSELQAVQMLKYCHELKQENDLIINDIDELKQENYNLKESLNRFSE